MTAIIIDSTPSLEDHEIQKGINLLGLNISEVELSQLKSGNTISLESRLLSEIGSVFILADALSAMNSVKNLTFQDLQEVVTKFSYSSGVPIYCWDSEQLGNCCLLLTLIDGKPAVRVRVSSKF